jgi:hypothetical protein
MTIIIIGHELHGGLWRDLWERGGGKERILRVMIRMGVHYIYMYICIYVHTHMKTIHDLKEEEKKEGE